ncbi:uncharacterized protein LOC116578854 [Mustela erminea]|uniref:uncharacterized protein LOC116578854 n=1 Tax=Mustela erminea TaxID=36723 RepID=UPI001387195D|nr:uncharacterized protein LOC116578854 [Mustela erminea]
MRRPQQLGCGPSLETPSRLLASAHPGLPASTDIAKEACSPTRTGGWIGGGQVSDVQADSSFPRWETRAKGRGFLASAAYTDIMALWDTQPGSSVCSSPHLLPRTRIQVQTPSLSFLLRVWNLWRPPLSQLLPSFVDYISRALSWEKKAQCGRTNTQELWRPHHCQQGMQDATSKVVSPSSVLLLPTSPAAFFSLDLSPHTINCRDSGRLQRSTVPFGIPYYEKESCAMSEAQCNTAQVTKAPKILGYLKREVKAGCYPPGKERLRFRDSWRFMA